LRKVLVIATLAAALGSCSEQERARSYGGTAAIDLPPCTKLVNMTWKESDLWVLSRPIRSGEVAEQYEFVESHVYGMKAGKITIRESRNNTCPA